jgi:hypothetical protein
VSVGQGRGRQRLPGLGVARSGARAVVLLACPVGRVSRGYPGPEWMIRLAARGSVLVNQCRGAVALAVAWELTGACRRVTCRPIYHGKRDSIEAHLTIVFAALAVSR